MSRPQLLVGKKTYSPWSTRACVLLRALDIDFEGVQLKLHADAWRREIGRWSPSGRAPVLSLDGEPVPDARALAEKEPSARRRR